MNTNWYITVDEFAKVVVDAVYECGYFKPGDRLHAEDIEGAFISTATAVAKGISFISNKVSEINTENVNTVINKISTAIVNDKVFPDKM